MTKISSVAIDKEGTIEIKAAPATPEETSWVEYQRQENQAMPRRLEDTAKYLSGLSSISLTIMMGPYNEVFRALRNAAGLKIGVLCWLLSIVFTLAVVFPFRYGYIAHSESSIRTMNKKISRVKFIFLLAGALFYLAGVSIVACFYLFYQPLSR